MIISMNYTFQMYHYAKDISHLIIYTTLHFILYLLCSV